jgi:hypothetical protein
LGKLEKERGRRVVGRSEWESSVFVCHFLLRVIWCFCLRLVGEKTETWRGITLCRDFRLNFRRIMFWITVSVKTIVIPVFIIFPFAGSRMSLGWRVTVESHPTS